MTFLILIFQGHILSMMTFPVMHTIMILPTILVIFGNFWLRVDVLSRNKTGNPVSECNFFAFALSFSKLIGLCSLASSLCFL